MKVVAALFLLNFFATGFNPLSGRKHFQKCLSRSLSVGRRAANLEILWTPSGILTSKWSKLLSLGKRVSLKKGEEVNASEMDKLLFIMDGEISLESGGWRLRKFGPGNFVGHSVIVDSNTAAQQSDTLTCQRDTVCIEWGKDEIVKLMQNNQSLGMDLQACIIKDLEKTLRCEMENLENKDSSSYPTSPSIYIGDYGYRRPSPPSSKFCKGTPVSMPALSSWNFKREFKSLRQSIRTQWEVKSGNFLEYLAKTDIWLENTFPFFPKLNQLREEEVTVLTTNMKDLRAQLSKLTLNNTALSEREQKRWKITKDTVNSPDTLAVKLVGKIKQTETSKFVLVVYAVLCFLLDTIFENRPVQRFWVLELIARMPYFSYISMLHLYETLGWWTEGQDTRKVHFAEEWNEMRHLQIMEALGGNSRWMDRFLGRHAAIVYYWLLNALFLFSPHSAYNFSELIESHACDTYSQFLFENEHLLKSLPPPQVAIEYYMSGDMYLFDEFQTTRAPRTRRPVIKTLYDVFLNIALDEVEHTKTMKACQLSEEQIKSPNTIMADKLDEKLEN